MPARISIHARARFRSRYMRPDEREEIGDQVADDWLRGLLRVAVRDGAFEDVIDDGRPLRVFELAARRRGGEPVYACQREDGTVVSLLELWQRNNNRQRRWTRPDGSVIGLSSVGDHVARGA